MMWLVGLAALFSGWAWLAFWWCTKWSIKAMWWCFTAPWQATKWGARQLSEMDQVKVKVKH